MKDVGLGFLQGLIQNRTGP